MMAVEMLSKNALKEALAELPLAAEVYWSLRQGGGPVDQHFNLDRLEAALPSWQHQAEAAARSAGPKASLVIFATLRYWIEYSALVGLAFAGLGHPTTITYLPYDNWKKPGNRFDLRRQNAYARRVLRLAEPTLSVVSLYDIRPKAIKLPPALKVEIEELALRDVRYSLQVEEVEPAGDLYRLRLERDVQAARAALSWLEASRPDVVILPNGSILEFGAVYAVARYLGIRLVTFEFGEQNQRLWLAQDSLVMSQETDALWDVRKDIPLSQGQREQVERLFASRQGARRWENFARRWQGAPAKGAAEMRQGLGLDTRPVVLMTTNVIGDSLTLGRQVFSQGMTEWIERTAAYFASRNNCQFIVRIHPGEALVKGPSVLKILEKNHPKMPENFRLIPADSDVNTYDLIANADLGLVYTTTAGLEMVMSGVPVMVAGRTHYRGKGFTIDPDSWDGYLGTLDAILENPAAHRPSEDQIELAWRYSFSFFFEFPRPFPWHLVFYWDKIDKWPLERVFSEEGQASFGTTFRQLAGERISWEELLGLREPPLDD
jgi:Capsule polysaccharide biosynthesis protein